MVGLGLDGTKGVSLNIWESKGEMVYTSPDRR